MCVETQGHGAPARTRDRHAASDRRGPTDKLLTKDEAAEVLKVAVRFIERCVVERRIRYVKVGRYIRIPESAIDEYVEASTVPAYSPAPRPRPGSRR